MRLGHQDSSVLGLRRREIHIGETVSEKSQADGYEEWEETEPHTLDFLVLQDHQGMPFRAWSVNVPL